MAKTHPALKEWDGKIKDRLPHQPPRAVERRARRARVEMLLLSTGWTNNKIAQAVAKEFKVSTKTVWDDLKLIQGKWEKEDTKYAQMKRTAVVRRFEALWEKAYEAENFRLALDINKALAKVLGMTGDDRVINNIVVNNEKDPEKRRDLLQDAGLRLALKRAHERIDN